MVSQMARLSHTVTVLPPSSIFKTGTRPAPEYWRIVSRVALCWVSRNRITTSVKGWPVAQSAR